MKPRCIKRKKEVRGLHCSPEKYSSEQYNTYHYTSTMVQEKIYDMKAISQCMCMKIQKQNIHM